MSNSASAKLAYFVTGTDTEIGKTLISSALLYALTQQGLRAAGMKPVAAGAELRDGVWRNEDADRLAAAANVSLPQELTTPYLLREATAPHIAAQQEGVTIDAAHIRACYDQVAGAADAVVVEGVGGFRVPLSDSVDTADLAQQLGLPVIMVVGLRLGCLNHALLTAEAIAARGLKLVGWVANVVDLGMRYGMDNLNALTARLPAPMLGCVPRLPAALPNAAASHLDFSSLPGWPKGQAAPPHST
ncbi:dethiobiotin synthase [Noviherbaspirillum autotrophicum]|uniref:ATP-dependent dethiobiotin synthetase BioD n=1 Tax=Noviherbaspirillum autotrophicum TaxID=709839 RepID=A0A0C2BFX6_9BURK|nr:dethiobiotin synthase [Noviherbaspirillum autotrophicum]KIF80145.1 dethiobiotin synthetase [Noviherbaspirillum autotrophicum]